MQVLYSSETLTLSWVPTDRYLKVERSGFIKGAAFRRELELIVEELTARRASRQLNDFRKMKPVAPDDQDFINRDWLPRLVRAGLRHSAVLAPESAIAQMSLTAIVARVADTELVTQYFAHQDAAVAWLRQA
jgi:hypothetical protein